MKRLSSVFFSFTLLSLSQLASARCDYSDLAGTWEFYGASQWGYTICSVRITGSGDLNSKWSTCKDLNGFSSPALQGSETFNLKTDSNCNLSGTTDTRFFGRSTLIGTINRDRSVIVLFGTNGSAYTTLHGIKK